MEKHRLDQYLCEQGLAQSRARAKSAIEAGYVYVNGTQTLKANTGVGDGDDVELRGTDCIYVSRGGLKLEKALSVFSIDLEGAVCLDIGASTGGFTDCMLRSGAKRVYALDVGTAQLASSLAADERVINLEQTHVRSLCGDIVPDPLDFFSVDVSFISLSHVFEALPSVCMPACMGVCLIKPQFEAGRERLGKKGIVKDPRLHRAIIAEVIDHANASGFEPLGLDYSPIKGPDGNIEFLLHLQYVGKRGIDFEAYSEPTVSEDSIARVVASAHDALR